MFRNIGIGIIAITSTQAFTSIEKLRSRGAEMQKCGNAEMGPRRVAPYEIGKRDFRLDQLNRKTLSACRCQDVKLFAIVRYTCYLNSLCIYK